MVPPGYTHAACFLETALLLKSSLVSLGYTCDMQPNTLDPDRINILLGYHLVKYSERMARFRYIPYQLEQLSEREGIYSQNVHDLLANALQVWDYSHENIAFLQSRGISARLCVPGFHPALCAITAMQEPDIDILFFGSVNQRRKDLLDRLIHDTPWKVKTLFGVYGAVRDAWIARSKIILNIHHYDQMIFEAVRVSYLLNNRCCLVSEDSRINPYPRVPLLTAPYDDLPALCDHFLTHPDMAGQKALDMHQAFREHYYMPHILQNVLETLPDPA